MKHDNTEPWEAEERRRATELHFYVWGKRTPWRTARERKEREQAERDALLGPPAPFVQMSRSRVRRFA